MPDCLHARAALTATLTKVLSVAGQHLPLKLEREARRNLELYGLPGALEGRWTK